jgi:hypothetical protein
MAATARIFKNPRGQIVPTGGFMPCPVYVFFFFEGMSSLCFIYFSAALLVFFKWKVLMGIGPAICTRGP